MKQVTFVVHGVGEPKGFGSDVDPATRDLAHAWARSHGNAPLTQTRMISQVGDSAVDYTVFSTTTPAAGNGDEHHVVELQWADLSTLWGGRLRAVVGLFSLIIGLRHVASAAGSAVPNRGWADWMSRGIFWLMRRPVLTINWALAAGLLLVIAFPWRGYLSSNGVTIAAGALIASPILLPSLRKERLAQWAAGLGVVLATMPFWPHRWLLGLAGATGAQPSFLDYFFTLITVLNLCWLTVAVASAFLIVAWPFGRRGLSPERRRNFDALLLVTLLAIRVWSFGIPLLWSGLLAVARYATDKQGPDALLTTPALDRLTEASIPTMGTNWVLFFLILLAAALAYRLFHRVSTLEGAAFAKAGAAPKAELRAKHKARLLIGRLLLAALAFTTIAADAFMFKQLYGGGRQRDQTSDIMVITPRPAGPVTASTYKWGMRIGVGLAVAAVLLRRRVGTALDFAIDFTNYFRPPATGAQSIPQKVRARFDRVVADVLAVKRPDRVVFVTHSQGTVYAGEFLQAGGCPQAELVTMGSPISHIYGHYLDGAFWRPPQGPPRVGEHVSRWENLFRWNDYIGRTVDDATDDHEVGPGSHPGYFKDDKVMARLLDLRLVP